MNNNQGKQAASLNDRIIQQAIKAAAKTATDKISTAANNVEEQITADEEEHPMSYRQNTAIINKPARSLAARSSWLMSLSVYFCLSTVLLLARARLKAGLCLPARAWVRAIFLNYLFVRSNYVICT